MPATYVHSIDNSAHMLLVAFDLGWKTWCLAFGTALGGRIIQCSIDARDVDALRREMARAKAKLNLPDDASVLSCYEAGRDGFWLHRFLKSIDVQNHVVDSASIEVNRRQRRNKSDRVDAQKLLAMLMRYELGERGLWSVVHVPGVEDEVARHLHRELETLKKDRTRHSNRIKGWLANCGLKAQVDRHLLTRLQTLRLWDGSAVPLELCRRIKCEMARRDLVNQQILQIKRERRRLLRESKSKHVEQVRQLMRLRAIGENSAWVYATEFFGWRKFRNRREVGGLSGLTPAAQESGEQRRDLGISRAGNRHIRAMAVEIAWAWLRFQPASELSRWYERRFGHGSKRLRKIGIVALARKLLIKLWQYLETGALPEGAVLKAV